MQLPKDPELAKAMAAAFSADEAAVGSTEPLGPPKWIPPHHPTLEGHSDYSSSVYSLFDWWWASIEVKDPHHGWWAHLYEWNNLRLDWLPVTRVFGETIGQAHSKARALARKLLIEGERPQAEAVSPELARMVAFWREHGTHMLARDA